jgi:hypothetical protein
MAVVGLVCAVAFFAFAAWFALSGWTLYDRLTGGANDPPALLHRIEIGILKVAGPTGLLAAWELVAALFAFGGLVSAWEAYKLYSGRAIESDSRRESPWPKVAVAGVGLLLVMAVVFYVIGIV